MSALPAAPPEPAPPPDPKRRFIEVYGSAQVTVQYLRVAVALLAVVSLGLVALQVYVQRIHRQWKPLVIRIDDVGRAEAVRYDALTYAPRNHAPELKYFLVQFVTKHFGRMRASVRAAFAESLLFLDARFADAVIVRERRNGEVDTFLSDGSDEIEIRVKNVTFGQFTPPRFRASVDFEKVFHPAGGGPGRSPEMWVAQISFELRDEVPNALVPVNPLGLTITELRLDQAFR